uniref:Uncharacterized protein n=1 Tax=Magallana gigas TaxID=29159 RepID=K1PX22_MAGGI
MGKLLPIVGTSKIFHENIFLKISDDAVKHEIQKNPLVLQLRKGYMRKMEPISINTST